MTENNENNTLEETDLVIEDIQELVTEPVQDEIIFDKETIRVVTSEDARIASTRLIQMAADLYDQTINEAETKADEIIQEAVNEAETRTLAANSEIETLTARISELQLLESTYRREFRTLLETKLEELNK